MGIVKMPDRNNPWKEDKEYNIWDSQWDDLPSVQRRRNKIIAQERKERLEKIKRIQEEEGVSYYLAELYFCNKRITDDFLHARKKRKQHEINQNLGGDIKTPEPIVDISWKELYEILGEENLHKIDLDDVYDTINTILKEIQKTVAIFEVPYCRYSFHGDREREDERYLKKMSGKISTIIDVLKRYLSTELPLGSAIDFEPLVKNIKTYKVREESWPVQAGPGWATFIEYETDVTLWFRVKFSYSNQF